MTTLRQLACGPTFLAAGCRGALAEDRHQIARVSVDSFGRQADSLSFASKISAEGRYVALWSRASNLVPHDTNNADDIFVHDCKTGQTERVSVSTSGAQADGASALPSISADGRFVVFASGATNLVPGHNYLIGYAGCVG